MCKVLIVDDADIFREYLRNQIHWEENDFTICGEATDGMNALTLVEATKPDIAIIDIEMPNMDGLSLSRKLKDKYEDIGIILISGYDEFEYARAAITIGVEDYFVKPFGENELMRALLRTRERLYKRKRVKEEGRNNLYEIRERALNTLISRKYNINSEYMKNHLEQIGVPMRGIAFLVTTIEINNLYERWNIVNDLGDDRTTVINITNNMFKEIYNQIAFHGPENRIISIISFKNKQELNGFKPDIYKELRRFLYHNFDISVTVGIGTVINDLMNIRSSYLNSLYLISNKSHQEAGEVLLYHETKSLSNNLKFYPSAVYDRLSKYLRMNDVKHITEELDNIFNYCINNRQSLEYNYAIIIGLKSVCMSYIIEMNEIADNVLGHDFFSMQVVDHMIPLEEAKGIIYDMFRKTIEHFIRLKPTRTRKVAEMVKGYIDSHYADTDLSLEKIAKHFFLNYDYIRRAFKKELNNTVTDYITSVRMQKVKELINNGNSKLSCLCYEVGISDASYFSKCFKKYFGLSPRDYENLIK